MTEEPRSDTGDEPRVFPAERLKAFTDAVVAIAMTLLILPLLESVSDTAAGGDDAGHWVAEHQQQIFSFVLSFALIALFWTSHHRLFAGVHRVTNRLVWLTVLWMLTIVWLPVPTAMSGQMGNTDAVVKILYIGTMIATSLASLIIRLYLRRHTDLHDMSPRLLLNGVAVDLSTAMLFALALVVSLLFPDVGYWALLLMFLSGVLQSLLARMLGVAPPRTRRA